MPSQATHSAAHVLYYDHLFRPPVRSKYLTCQQQMIACLGPLSVANVAGNSHAHAAQSWHSTDHRRESFIHALQPSSMLSACNTKRWGPHFGGDLFDTAMAWLRIFCQVGYQEGSWTHHSALLAASGATSTQLASRLVVLAPQIGW